MCLLDNNSGLSSSTQPAGVERRIKEIMEIIRRVAIRERLSMEAICRINGAVMIGPLPASVTTRCEVCLRTNRLCVLSIMLVGCLSNADCCYVKMCVLEILTR